VLEEEVTPMDLRLIDRTLLLASTLLGDDA
jgi:hypothetical protein